MKNKTIAAWLAFLTGPLGGHRFYLYGMGDLMGWLLLPPTALGLYGVRRMLMLGQDDGLAWLLIPLLGFTFAGCAVTAIAYGLTTPEKWNARFNPGAPPDAAPGQSHWFTIGAVAAALLVGTGVLMASIVFSAQRYFEYQLVQQPGTAQAPGEKYIRQITARKT